MKHHDGQTKTHDSLNDMDNNGKSNVIVDSVCAVQTRSAAKAVAMEPKSREFRNFSEIANINADYETFVKEQSKCRTLDQIRDKFQKSIRDVNKAKT